MVGRGARGEHVLHGGIVLQLSKMTEDDPLIVKAGGVDREDHGNPVIDLGWSRMTDGRCKANVLNPLN